MYNFTRRVGLASVLFLSISMISFAQQNPVTTSVTGHLIRVTPPLSQIDGGTMYGQPLKITRQGTGFAGGVIDPERAEENIFHHYPNKDKVTTTTTNAPVTPILNAPTTSVLVNIDGQTAAGFAPSDNNLAV